MLGAAGDIREAWMHDRLVPNRALFEAGFGSKAPEVAGTGAGRPEQVR